MTIAFISDLHLAPGREIPNRLFEDYMGRTGRVLERLYILGDLFDYWIGDDAAAELGQEPVEAAIRSATGQGAEVFFLPGNRDFLVGEAFAERTGCTLLPDPTVIDLDGEKVLLAHGDDLCTDDTEHQKARALLRDPEWQRDFLARPVAERAEMARNVRYRSELGKQEKAMEIMDVNQAAVERTMRAHGVKILVHGHTHRPDLHTFDLDGEPARRYVLGDWLFTRSVLYYARGRFYLSK